MIRDGKMMVTHFDHRFIIQQAALGDMISSLPAVIHAMRTTPSEVKLSIYVPPWQLDLVRHLLAPYGTIDVRDINEVPTLAASKARDEWRGAASVSMNGAVQSTHTRNRVHMVDYAFNFLLDARPESMAERNYPTDAPLGPVFPDVSTYARYVVVPVGATSDNKLFKASVMQPVVDWLSQQGYGIAFVGTKMSFTRAQMGDKLGDPLVIRDEFDKLVLPAGSMDARERTTLLELRDVLGHAAAVVGIDGGTLHLAGTTDVPIVYASGTTLPKHRYIARHGNPSYKIRYVGPRDLECTGCQSVPSLTRHDFRFCPFNDNKCMDLLNPDDFIQALKELGI